MNRKQMIRFISMIDGRSEADIELLFYGKPDEFIIPMFQKMEQLRDERAESFLAA